MKNKIKPDLCSSSSYKYEQRCFNIFRKRRDGYHIHQFYCDNDIVQISFTLVGRSFSAEVGICRSRLTFVFSHCRIQVFMKSWGKKLPCTHSFSFLSIQWSMKHCISSPNMFFIRNNPLSCRYRFFNEGNFLESTHFMRCCRSFLDKEQ